MRVRLGFHGQDLERPVLPVGSGFPSSSSWPGGGLRRSLSSGGRSLSILLPVARVCPRRPRGEAGLPVEGHLCGPVEAVVIVVVVIPARSSSSSWRPAPVEGEVARGFPKIQPH